MTSLFTSLQILEQCKMRCDQIETYVRLLLLYFFIPTPFVEDRGSQQLRLLYFEEEHYTLLTHTCEREIGEAAAAKKNPLGRENKETHQA